MKKETRLARFTKVFSVCIALSLIHFSCGTARKSGITDFYSLSGYYSGNTQQLEEYHPDSGLFVTGKAGSTDVASYESGFAADNFPCENETSGAAHVNSRDNSVPVVSSVRESETSEIAAQTIFREKKSVTPDPTDDEKKAKRKKILKIVAITFGCVLIALIVALVIALSRADININPSCYIATMAYGSYDAEEVIILRRFRDEKLKPSKAGRSFIRFYYTVSPYLVALLKHNRMINRGIRLVLDRFVSNLARKQGNRTDLPS